MSEQTEQTEKTVPTTHDLMRAALREFVDSGRLDARPLLQYIDAAEATERELASVKQGYDLLDMNWEKHHEACMKPIRAAAVGDEGATIPEIVGAINRSNQAVTALFGERKCAHCGKDPTCFGSYEGSEYAYACDECCGHACEDGRCVPVVDLEQAELVAAIEPHLTVMRDCVGYVVRHGHVQKDSADAEKVRKTQAALAGLRF